MDFLVKFIYKNKKKIIYFGIIVLVFSFLFTNLIVTLRKENNKIIHISSGQTTQSIYKNLKDQNLIKKENFLRFFIKIFGGENNIVPGDYLIKKGTPVYLIAWRISRGDHNISPIKITLREGLNNEQISNILNNKIKNFDKNDFILKTTNKQGYLFPDTYFIFSLDTNNEIINKLENNFESNIKKVNSLIEKSGRSLDEIIIMASVLEGEASGKDDIGIISGILWKRISIGMPLQVDVERDTYKTKGLPNKPINNPGMMSIKAAISPVYSNYLYYLHDKNGKVHYAKTFEEHRNNIIKYLK